MMKTTLPALLAAGALATLLTACAPGRAEPGYETSASAPEAPHDDAEVLIPDEADEAAAAAATDAALAALTAYAMPQLERDAWMDGMYPHLTQQGAEAYLGTDPARIPVSQVLDSGTVLEGSTEVALIVQFQTDAGPYNVSMSRAGTDARWLAARLQPAVG